MQRINWFPDPNITGTVKPIGNNKTKVECPVVVDSRNWMRATSTATGDNYVQYLLFGSQIPPAGSYHVHAVAYAHGAQASLQVFYRVGGSYKQPLAVPVGQNQTVIVDQTITLPAGCDQMFVRLQLDATTVGAIGMMSEILIERADTYDNAVGGGASGLLHRRHDATSVGAFVGRVVSDDDREHLPGNKGENTGKTALASEVRGRTQRQLLHSLHCGKCWENANDRQAIRNLQLVHFAGNCRERTCVRCRHLACQLWRFGHHCDRHHDLRELQCHEKDIRRAGNNRIRRGYDAARLTLMGVMA